MLEYLDLLHVALRYSHVAAGFLGLALFWVPIFAVKGSPLHIRCGRVFVWMAYYVGATALVSSVWCLCHPTSFLGATWESIGSRGRPYVLEQMRFIFSILGYLALAILCGAVFGVRVVRTRHDHALLRSRWLLGLQGALGLWSLGLAIFGVWNLAMIYAGRHLLPSEAAGRYWIPVALGIFGMLGAKGEIAYILKPRPTPMAWWYKHMENMLGVGIGFHTAFLVFGLLRFLPIRLEGTWQLVPWLLPAAIGIPATHLWIRYYQRKFGELQPPATSPGSHAAEIVL
jgi:hypothetical protein